MYLGKGQHRGDSTGKMLSILINYQRTLIARCLPFPWVRLETMGPGAEEWGNSVDTGILEQ